MNFLAFKLISKSFQIPLHRPSLQLLNSIRHASVGCTDDGSKCAKLRSGGNTCKDNAPHKPPAKLPKKKKFVSMWANPKCDPSVSKCPQIRFDDLYYKTSDKAKRKYQQTWVSCPPRVVKQKVVCEGPVGKYPPLERRPRKSRPDTAKCMAAKKTDHMDCGQYGKTKQNQKCLKITLPGCRSARSDVKCKLIRGPADCNIVRPPYPSFSECTRPKIKKKRPTECECLKIRSMCEVWTILRQKAIL